MKFDKQLAIILVLLSMLLSAVAVSVYFYNQKQEVIQSSNQLVTIFVATKDIKKDTLITEEHIKQTSIAKQYVLTKPLLKNEILNKYAKESIYVNEAFLKEKLTTKIEIEEEKKLDFKYNSYNMDYSMFRNKNYMIEPDDVIKIVSVTNENGLSVQYVIKNIRVLGFVSDGMYSEKSIFKKKITKIVNKKSVEEIVNVRASELILDIQEKDMLSLIKDWNRGGQLWMVKSKIEEENKEKDTVSIEKEIKEEIKNVEKKVVSKPKTYPVKWYYPSNKNVTKTAIIEYADKPDFKKSKSVKLPNESNEKCSNRDKILLVTSDKAYLREHPSIRAKIVKKIYKNYVISYDDLSKINNNWYVICDGSYIRKSDVKIITYEEYKNLKR